MSLKSRTQQELIEAGVVAVVRAETGEQAVQASRALLQGGVRGIEITFTVPDAARVIAQLAEADRASELPPGMLLGAGTVLTAAQADAACDSGARFLVSPCVVPAVIAVAQRRGVLMLTGALAPTEIHTAFCLGSDIVKLFPAARFGPQYLKDIRGPLPHIPVMPTGGVDATNAAEWLAAGAIALGVGGKLVEAAAIRNGDWATLTARAEELMEAVRAARERG